VTGNVQPATSTRSPRYDHAAIMQRSLGEKERDHEFRRKFRVEFRATFADWLEILIPLDRNKSTELPIREVEGRVGELLDHLRRLGGGGEHAMAAQCGERPPDFRLEQNDHRKDEGGGNVPEDPAQDGQIEEAPRSLR
jgi:hypothetical protein